MNKVSLKLIEGVASSLIRTSARFSFSISLETQILVTPTSRRDVIAAPCSRRALAIGRPARRSGGAMIGTVGALSAAAILADRSSSLSPSGQPPTLHRPAEPLPKLSASCLAPLLVNAEKSRRAIVRVARTAEPAKKEEEEEEAETADEERGGGERGEKYRKSIAAGEKYNIGTVCERDVAGAFAR